MNFFEAEEYISNLGMFGIKMGLEQTEELFNAAGVDHSRLKFIHLAGTNGKGSCGAMLQQMLKSVGFKVGFYTSPHLISIRERFRVNGVAISEEDFSLQVEKLKKATEKLAATGARVTYFELTTVLAASYFLSQDVDWVIWETGMGGRLDATNVVTPIASVITNIAMDHQQYLGDTHAKIAMEKGGIIKNGVPVFAGRMNEEAAAEIKKKANENNSPLFWSADEQTLEWCCLNGVQRCRCDRVEVDLPLAGAMQRRNFMTAKMVIEYLSAKFKFSLVDALVGIAKVRWPGRAEMIAPDLWVDGGHNPDGVAALVETVRSNFTKKPVIIFGAFRDKAAHEELKLLETIAEKLIFVTINEHERACYTADELGTMTNLNWSTAENITAAVENVRKDKQNIALVTGSLYLVADALKEFSNADAILNI